MIWDATSKKCFESGFPEVKSVSLSIASLFDNPACLSLIVFRETPCTELQVLVLKGTVHPEKNKIKDRARANFIRVESFGNFVSDGRCLILRSTLRLISC